MELWVGEDEWTDEVADETEGRYWESAELHGIRYLEKLLHSKTGGDMHLYGPPPFPRKNSLVTCGQTQKTEQEQWWTRSLPSFAPTACKSCFLLVVPRKQGRLAILLLSEGFLMQNMRKKYTYTHKRVSEHTTQKHIQKQRVSTAGFFNY